MRTNNRGLTLLEIMIAISLIGLITAGTSGVFLSFSNIANGAVDSGSAQRNAQIAIMHIQKNASLAASGFDPIDSFKNKVGYKIFGGNNIYFEPTLVRRYEFANNQIRYYPDDIIVVNHIQNCVFEVVDNVMLSVTITALDRNNNPETAYTTSTLVSATAAPSLPVY
jgi:prepilin-type N-terminal cleavage/methylation domain-containing protein